MALTHPGGRSQKSWLLLEAEKHFESGRSRSEAREILLSLYFDNEGIDPKSCCGDLLKTINNRVAKALTRAKYPKVGQGGQPGQGIMKHRFADVNVTAARSPSPESRSGSAAKKLKHSPERQQTETSDVFSASQRAESKGLSRYEGMWSPRINSVPALVLAHGDMARAQELCRERGRPWETDWS